MEQVKDDAQAQEMLGALEAHFGEPVLPVSRYCDAIDKWILAIQRLNLDPKWQIPRSEPPFGPPQGNRYHELLQTIRIDVRKSNLLWRVIYCGEDVRTVPCPIHKGHWTGYSFRGCVLGCGETGWMPEGMAIPTYPDQPDYLSPEERLWVAILLRDVDVGSMDDAKAAERLGWNGFPKETIDAYLRARRP